MTYDGCRMTPYVWQENNQFSSCVTQQVLLVAMQSVFIACPARHPCHCLTDGAQAMHKLHPQTGMHGKDLAGSKLGNAHNHYGSEIGCIPDACRDCNTDNNIAVKAWLRVLRCLEFGM